MDSMQKWKDEWRDEWIDGSTDLMDYLDEMGWLKGLREWIMSRFIRWVDLSVFR